jgi:hypothetical protein
MRAVRAVLACLAALALAAPAAGAVRTLAAVDGTIAALAQDRGRVVWAVGSQPRGGCPWRVVVLRVATGSKTQVAAPAGPTCTHDVGFQPQPYDDLRLALAGTRALWTLVESGNFRYVDVVTAAVGHPPDVALGQLVWQYGLGEGDHLGGVAGSGALLAYSWIRSGVDGPPDCDIEGTCETPVVGGGVRIVENGTTRDLPGAPPAVLLATAAGRLALVPAASGGERPAAAPGWPVEVRDAETGGLVAVFTPVGLVEAVALSASTAAVLVRDGGAVRIERYDAVTGAPLGSTPVNTGAAPELGIADRWIVFRVGRSIRALDVEAGTVTGLATAARRPVGLSVEGRRVAWAEVLTEPAACPPRCGRSRVRAVQLPA